MFCPASSGGNGLRAASQVVRRPARDRALLTCASLLGASLGVHSGYPCLDRPGLEDPGLRNCPGSGYPSVPG